MNLEEKLYTSTEVAKILGVSLRSVYRYLEQDKLEAEIKTATGRLRFTKKNIEDFLYPDGEGAPKEASREKTSKERDDKAIVGEGGKKEDSEDPEEKEPEKELEEEVEEKEEVVEEEPEKEEDEEEIDWLAKFRAAAKEYSIEKEADEETKKEEVSSLESDDEGTSKFTYKYYRSSLGGLKEIAQNIDKISRKSNVNYAFTLHAGLSLDKPLKKPFSVLHAYVESDSEPLFERMLKLEETDEGNAQVCFLFPKDNSVFEERREKHGLYVASTDSIEEDFSLMGLGEEYSSLA